MPQPGRGAEQQRAERDQQARRRRAPPQRQVGLGDDADVLGVDLLLLAGFARAHQERLIEVAARLRLAFQFAQADHGLIVIDGGALERLEIVGERLLAGLGALIFGAGGDGGAVDLVVDHVAQAFRLRLDVEHGRMPRPERGHLLGLAAHHFGVLAAQGGDGLRQQRRRERAVLVLGLLHLRHLVEPALGLGGAGARGHELRIHLGQLLFGYELAVAADHVVACAIVLDLLFGVAHAIAQILQPRRQRLRHLARRIGADLRLFGEIGVGDGVGDARRLFRTARGDVDLDHVSALVALDGDAAPQLGERRERLVVGGGVAMNADDTEDVFAERAQRRAGADEFGIFVEIERGDDAAQHRVRAQDPHLALDLQQAGVAQRRRRRCPVADGEQVGWIDEDLRRRRILPWRHRDEDQRQHRAPRARRR